MDNTVSAQKLQKSEERYKLASLASNDGLWDLDLLNPENNFISPRFMETLGYQKGDYCLVVEEWLDHVHPEDLKKLKDDFVSFINSDQQIFSNEHRLRCKNGEYRWFSCRGIALREKDAEGQPTGKAYRIAGAHTDINDRKKAENELRHWAFHDTLTGLPNRILFQDRLERSYQRLQRNGDYRFAVLFLDFDRFKDINDTLGHDTGDSLLLEIASRLKETLREIDTIARFGGDEFVLLLEEIQNIETAELLAERILKSLEKPFEIKEHIINISASIGVVISNLQQHARPEDLIRDADIAMYQAKANGRACYEVFDTEMRAELLSRAILETDLRRAIQKKEFSLVYQPIVSLVDNQIEGFEALIRWQTKEKGFVDPEKFIPLAEETGLIVPIGKWVIEEACHQMKNWQQQGISGSMNVNLSGVQLAQANIVEMIEEILHRTELPPQLLHIEITESALIKDIESAIIKLEQLKAIGINIHMDDFGTGYSSLSQLRLLPVDSIKIDRSFIRNLDNNKNDLGLVRAIISMANGLKLTVIAEGIENEIQRELLQTLHCGYGQGYFLYRPRLGSEMAEILFEKENLK